MTLTTSSLLKDLGAVEDPGAIQDDDGALRLPIGPYCVHGGQYMSRWFKRTYRISAVIDARRSISLVESEMPAELASEDEGLAWLAEILREALPDEAKPAWLLKGEGLRHLLRERTSDRDGQRPGRADQPDA
ncbi:MAG TPA: hypothetical protein VEZ20_11725 [Allosphingosinicella sp.]|jgi:hypothetical protein|nr:hypothetical protein [Allosphingosinicella sp.]